RAGHLHAEPALDLDLSAVVDPRDPEDDHPFGLEHALEHLRLAVAGVALLGQFDRSGDLLNGLVEFRFARVLGGEARHEPVHVLAHAAEAYVRVRLRWEPLLPWSTCRCGWRSRPRSCWPT